MENDFDREELLQVFLAETEENVATIEQSLLALEAAPGDREIVDTVFRAAHTVKGNAASLGFDAVAKLAHAMEDLLDRMRSGRRPSSSGAITLLLRGGDALRRVVASGFAEAATELSEERLIAELERAAAGDDIPVEQGGGAGTVSLSLDAAQTRKLRVDLEKLDGLLNLTGELAIASGKLFDAMDHLPEPHRERMLSAYGDLDRSLNDLQEQITRVRMVPIGPRFEQQRRTVRDLAASSNKPMRLLIEGHDVAIDASVVERIKDPLTHLIRNAADHGIEPAEVRRAKGKDPVATITLRAYYDGGGVIIQISDDGGGFDIARILSSARERRMVASDQTPSRDEILSYVFVAGLTTAEKVTELSGRGVGMDVVHRGISALRGTVSLTSRDGEGATVSMRLPLTLAVLDGLAVAAGGERFLLPMQAIRECMALPDGHDPAELCGLLEGRDRMVPFIRLAGFFGLGDRRPDWHAEQVVLVESAGTLVGLVTDELIGEMQVVLKPLGKLFQQLRGVAASTIFGDGRVGLVVDIAALVAVVSKAIPTAPEPSRSQTGVQITDRTESGLPM